jgi:aminopeptidase N
MCNTQPPFTETFWRGIREYYRRYMNASASTDDLRHVMEEVSGQDLRWFFTQWLNRPGVPKLEGVWRYDTANKRVVVTLRQTIAADTEPNSVELDPNTWLLCEQVAGPLPRQPGAQFSATESAIRSQARR